jgi:hypothetical protein
LRFRLRRQHTLEDRTNHSSRYGQVELRNKLRRPAEINVASSRSDDDSHESRFCHRRGGRATWDAPPIDPVGEGAEATGRSDPNGCSEEVAG